jgi:uracil phosphoribosyltransferase
MVRRIQHPLIADELTRMRDPQCPSPEFRQRMRRIASLMVPCVTEDLATHTIECRTPLEITSGSRLSLGITLVPVLRAGLAFLDGFLDMIPNASVAHIGLARNEKTLLPESYYLKHPLNLADRDIIILDPMLATGGSAVEAVHKMKHAGAHRIRFACLVAAPEGIAALHRAHPELPVFTAAIDRCLNDMGYILPGLGDAGDRIFGTST